MAETRETRPTATQRRLKAVAIQVTVAVALLLAVLLRPASSPASTLPSSSSGNATAIALHLAQSAYHWDRAAVPQCGPTATAAAAGTSSDSSSRHCIELSMCLGTREFVRRIVPQQRGRGWALFYHLLHRILRLPHYDTAALLSALRSGTQPELFLLSQQQWRQLLDLPADDGSETAARPLDRGLDVGAGPGDLTQELQGLFRQPLLTTEVSRILTWRLRAAGFAAIQTANASRATLPPPHDYDAVFALNVFDRCDDPLDLVRQLRLLLRPQGRLVLSVPLPYTGATLLPLSLRTGFADALAELVATLEPLGLRLDRAARAPYLCIGSGSTPLHTLDAAVVVFRRVRRPPVREEPKTKTRLD